MPVNLPLPDPTKLYPVAGVELGFAEVGVRKADRKDLLVIRKIIWLPARGFVRW